MLDWRLPARVMLLVAAFTMAMVSADGGIGFIVTEGCVWELSQNIDTNNTLIHHTSYIKFEQVR